MRVCVYTGFRVGGKREIADDSVPLRDDDDADRLQRLLKTTQSHNAAVGHVRLTI